MCKTQQIMLKMCKRGEGRNTNDFCDSRLREMNKQVFDRIYIRVSQTNTFFEYRFGGRITGANRCPEATKKISAL